MSLFHAMPSPNWNDRPAGQVIDLLILHYTGMVSAAAALARLCDPAAEVSAHYLIDEDGTVYALVEEQHRAWHAGKAFWRGDSAINSRSIGIELVNPRTGQVRVNGVSLSGQEQTILRDACERQKLTR